MEAESLREAIRLAEDNYYDDKYKPNNVIEAEMTVYSDDTGEEECGIELI